MLKTIILIAVIMVLAGLGYLIYQSSIPESVNPSSGSPATSSPAPSKEETIKGVFADKYGKNISDVTITIGQETDNYARGGVSFSPGGPENSGMFLAAKINGEWKIIHDGQGVYACSMVEYYDFPSGMVSDCSSEAVNYLEVTVETAKMLIETKPELIVIDVSPNYGQGHLPGAINYYVGDGSLDKAIPGLDRTKEYLVYCHVDSAAILGAQKLIDAGFSMVYRLKGNYAAWVNAGYPIEY